jgi:hypothetical protein
MKVKSISKRRINVKTIQTTFSTSLAKAMLSELVSRVEFKGETIILQRRNKDVAKIVPVKQANKERGKYLLRG